MSIRLCDKQTKKCFQHFFKTVDTCDVERMKTEHPSQFVCKAGDSIVGATPDLHVVKHDTSFLTNTSIYEYATVLQMPACKTEGYCELDNHKTQCCPHSLCINNSCQPILPQTLSQLNERIEALDYEDKIKFASFSDKTDALRLLHHFQNVAPSKGIENALKAEDLNMSTLSKLRSDSIICKPDIVVDGVAWEDGPYTCSKS